ncbi:biotin-protein ligase-like protein, partial [Trifolium pratense]
MKYLFLHFLSAVDCSLLVLCGKSLTENETAKAIKANNTLKLSDKEELSIILHSEINKNVLQQQSFQFSSFMSSLSTNQFGRLLIWSPQLSSTHDVISKNFCELPVGTVCVADIQNKGRGRSKNVWESPLGCLMFSFTLQMEDGRVVPLVQYVVSLAITEAIKDICDKNGLPCIDVKIKWPNDLYLNGFKVGGILCTSTYKSKKFNISAGIGLNVNNEKPTTSLNTVLRELSVGAYQFQREDVLAAFFNKFEKFFDLFQNQGTVLISHEIDPNRVRHRAMVRSLPSDLTDKVLLTGWGVLYACFISFLVSRSGQRVIVQEKIEDKVVEHVVTVQGLTSSGYLLAVGDDNQMCELHPDGN